MYGSDSGVPLRPSSPSQALTSSRLGQLDSFNGGSENLRSSAGGGTPREFDGNSMTGSQAKNWSAWASAADKETGLADGADGADGSVWVTQNRGNRPFGGKNYTGYDSQGVAHSLYQAPSTAASEQSHEAFSPRTGWAKSRDSVGLSLRSGDEVADTLRRAGASRSHSSLNQFGSRKLYFLVLARDLLLSRKRKTKMTMMTTNPFSLCKKRSTD